MAGKARHTATISLGVMSAGFLATLPFQNQLAGSLLQGAFEAGLVGGLADWFAVTALFRHPLGIPIPHTALLPKNREKLTDALVSAAENNLLNKESIASKIGQLRLAEMLLNMLDSEIRTDGAKTALDYLCKRLVRDFSFESLVPYLEKEIKRQLGSIDASEVIEQAIRQMIVRGYDEKALDYVLDKAEQWIVQPETRDRIGGMAMKAIGNLQLNGLMQFALNAFLGYLSEDKLGGMIQQFGLSQIRELRAEGHPRRSAMISRVRAELMSLGDNPSVREGINDWKASMLDDWQPGERLLQIAEQFRNTALVFMADGRYVESYVLPNLLRLLEQLRSDKEVLAKLEDRIKGISLRLLEENHSRIGALIRENIDRMDNEKLIEMMEEHVGKDLQWIRVNGAVCGFIIGLALTGIRLLVG